MTKTLTISGTDRTSISRQGPWIFSECAFRGQVGIGSVTLDDPGAALTIPAMKKWGVTEAAAAQTRVVTGWTNARRYQRGPFSVGGDRQIVVELYDLNTFLDDILLTSAHSADRPAETDYARVTWLLSTAAMTSADYGAVTAGQVPNSGTVTMDAIDYRGVPPRQVLDDCAQMSGKNFFVYWDTGAVPKLWYDDAGTSTALRSSLKISDTLADINNTTVFGPIYEGNILTMDPSLVRSAVQVKHKAGTASANSAGTVSSFRQREHHASHNRRMSSTSGGVQATTWVNKLGSETQLGQISIIVPAANVNDVRAGMAVQVKLRPAGISSYTYYRVIQRDVMPAPGDDTDAPSDVLYKVRLTFMDDVRPTALGVQPDSHQGVYTDEQKSNATLDNATVIIDRGGITITGGAITVTNPGGTVIIDGTSDMFRIATSGTLSIGPNTSKGVIYSSVSPVLGLTNNPLSIWSFKPNAYNNGDWTQMMPYQDIANSTGMVLNSYWGHTRKNGTKTDIQAALLTVKPPTPKVVYRYFVMFQSAI